MPSHTPAAGAGRAVVVTAAVAAVVLAATACGGSSTPSAAPTTDVSATSTATPAPDSAAAGLAVPGIPDPCGLVDAGAVMQAAHIPSGAKVAAIAAAGGGRSCGFNQGHPDSAIISLTAVTKAGFDSFRQQATDGVTDLPGIGQEAYRSTKIAGVVDVYKNGFDINVFVIHPDSSTQANADAKALAALVAPKL